MVCIKIRNVNLFELHSSWRAKTKSLDFVGFTSIFKAFFVFEMLQNLTLFDIDIHKNVVKNVVNPNSIFWGDKSDVSFGGKLFGYTTNCQTCVVAFKARMRGYDVRALPNNRNPYITDLSYRTNLAYVDKNGNTPSYIAPKRGERKLLEVAKKLILIM